MSTNWVPTKGAKTRRLAEERFHHLIAMQTLTFDNGFLEAAQKEVPEAWHTLEVDVDVEAPKEKVTLYLDRAVIAIFRRMGKGYQARINRILETWVQMKMAEKVQFQKEIMERVGEAINDKKREDPKTPMEKLRAQLVEHWAYEEGWNAAVKAMGEG
jgi:uncharacterized protein (DUF4415 family)